MTSYDSPAPASLTRCIGCHDQCMFTSVEVVVSGRQDLVMSRLASSAREVTTGALAADLFLLDALHMSTDQGAQQRHCIDLDGSQDPREWLAWARAAVAYLAGTDSAAVQELRRARTEAEQRLSAASPAVGDIDGDADIVLVRDALTGSLDPASGEALRTVFEAQGLRVAEAELVSCGTLEHFAGLSSDAAKAAADSLARLGHHGSATLVTDDPAVAYAAERIWPSHGSAPRVRHLGEVLAEMGSTSETSSTGPRVVINDVGLLAGDLGIVEPLRVVLRSADYQIVEPPSVGADARDDGPMFGYPDGDLRAAIGAARYEELIGTGAELIVTVAPWSRRNLPAAGPVPVVSLAEAVRDGQPTPLAVHSGAQAGR
ncbi:MAG: hypothetical protein ACK5MP_00400 [Nostocoides sp.]